MLDTFISIVIVVNDQANDLNNLLKKVSDTIHNMVIDYEIIIIDNGSKDESLDILRDLTSKEGLQNLQVFSLTKEVELDKAFWVGCENSLGDYICVFDPTTDDISFLPNMIEGAVIGNDVVFAKNLKKPKFRFFYSIAFKIFNWLYKYFNNIDLAKDVPSFRILSKRVINFVMQHPQPYVAYRHLPASAGFSRLNLEYEYDSKYPYRNKLNTSILKGLRLLISSSQAPMRLVTVLTLFGAAANLFYTVYILMIAIFKSDIADGWLSLSLQQSGMFFLISIVLLVLSEYVLKMLSFSEDKTDHYVAQELTSVRLTSKERLNIEESQDIE
mgnify:CR=1 FL=1